MRVGAYRDAGARSRGQKVTIRESTFALGTKASIRAFFPSRVTHARACERTRAYNRVKFDNKAGKLWTECLPRVDNTEGSYVPFIFPETYFHEYRQFANIGNVGYLSLLPRRACFFRLLEKFFNCSRNATKFLRHALQFQWNPCKWNILINIPRRFSI